MNFIIKYVENDQWHLRKIFPDNKELILIGKSSTVYNNMSTMF
jgi:hypothetical protein